MPTAEELKDKYKEELVDQNKGDELIPQVFLKGVSGINHQNLLTENGEVDRHLLKHMISGVQNPLDQNHHWLVFGSTVNVKRQDKDGELPDREEMRGDQPELSEMFMIQVVTNDEMVNFLYDSVTGELWEKADQSQLDKERSELA